MGVWTACDWKELILWGEGKQIRNQMKNVWGALKDELILFKANIQRNKWSQLSEGTFFCTAHTLYIHSSLACSGKSTAGEKMKWTKKWFHVTLPKKFNQNS